MSVRQTQVVRTVQVQVTTLDAEAIHEFSRVLTEQGVRPSAPVSFQIHEGQRGEPQGATLTATEVGG